MGGSESRTGHGENQFDSEGFGLFLTLPSQLATLRAIVPDAAEVMPLQVRSVAGSLVTYLPVRQEVLMVIASRWPAFLEVARTVLTAAGYDPEAALFLDANAEDWTRRVAAGSVAVCDVLTAAVVPKTICRIVFWLVSDTAIATLQEYEQFYGG